ncbi:MAG: diacylglycerol/lipid kinase family protein [Solirubrobacteraceae bacterium]
MDVLAIFNPNASRVDDRTQDATMRVLGSRGAVEAVRADHPFHAAELAAQAAAEGARLVVAVGGDGTANEAANGLVGSATALSCLPGGSSNVFARTLGAPSRLSVAAERLALHLREPAVRPMSTGTVAGRHFLFMSGIGMTAAMMRRIDQRPVLRARLGAGYVAMGAALALVEAGRGRLPPLVVDAGGERSPAATVIIQRSDPLTFFGSRPVRVCAPQSLGDETLSVALTDRAAPRDVASIFLRLLSGNAARVIAHPRVSAFERLDELCVSSPDGRPFGVEVDGTYMGHVTSARYGVSAEPLLVAGY